MNRQQVVIKTMVNEKSTGVFLGRTLVQQRGEIGGARSVFVKLQGNKNELVFPTFGGRIMNPFKGQAKIYAGDLIEFRTDENGVNPELYILKTYKVKSQTTTTIKIYRDGYKHIPFVGDILMKAPDDISAANGNSATVTAVSKATDGSDAVWVLTVDTAITLAANDILVESKAKATGTAKMLVKNINAVAPCDYDFVYSSVADPADDNDEFDAARYYMTPALGGTMYKSKMSPIPACCEAFNLANVNGWFTIDGRINRVR